VFSHGWPLSADDWDPQMLFFLSKGYRVIDHDRRGHGRSTQAGDGHDMDHYADDLKAVTDHLNLKDTIHVGHSTLTFKKKSSVLFIRESDSLGHSSNSISFQRIAVHFSLLGRCIVLVTLSLSPKREDESPHE
jgi:alpha/beta hydrolase fold